MTDPDSKDKEFFKIPYGKWENFDWYAERISEVSGMPIDSFRIFFAGCERFPENSQRRHSGLQYDSILQVVKRKLAVAKGGRKRKADADPLTDEEDQGETSKIQQTSKKGSRRGKQKTQAEETVTEKKSAIGEEVKEQVEQSELRRSKRRKKY